MKSIIFKDAWTYFKKNLFLTFSEALKAAWKAYKLKLALKSGKVSITFQKASGEITTRIATLSSDLFAYQSTTTSRTPKSDLIKFYSLTDEGFRACRIERLLTYNTI